MLKVKLFNVSFECNYADCYCDECMSAKFHYAVPRHFFDGHFLDRHFLDGHFLDLLLHGTVFRPVIEWDTF